MNVFRRQRGEAGFSLIELLVAIIILGILSTIAISTYLEQRQKANRSAAIAGLRNVLSIAELIKSDRKDGTYSPDAVDYQEPGAFMYVEGNVEAVARNVVSIESSADGRSLGAATWGGVNCYFLLIERGAQVRRHVDSFENLDLAGKECSGDEALLVPDTGWDI